MMITLGYLKKSNAGVYNLCSQTGHAPAGGKRRVPINFQWDSLCSSCGSWSWDRLNYLIAVSSCQICLSAIHVDANTEHYTTGHWVRLCWLHETTLHLNPAGFSHSPGFGVTAAKPIELYVVQSDPLICLFCDHQLITDVYWLIMIADRLIGASLLSTVWLNRCTVAFHGAMTQV